MSDTDPLDPFDDDVIRAVADANDVAFEPLEAAVRDHQRTMRDTPGVEDLVYEWRKQYDDPVLFRDPTAFIVAVPPAVWDEYGTYLDLEDDVFRALVAVHQEQTLRTDDVDLSGFPEGHATVVVGRA